MVYINMEYEKRPFWMLEGASCNMTLFYIIGQRQPVNIGDINNMHFAAQSSIARALDDLISAGLVVRSLGLYSSKPISLSEKGNRLYNKCKNDLVDILDIPPPKYP